MINLKIGLIVIVTLGLTGCCIVQPLQPHYTAYDGNGGDTVVESPCVEVVPSVPYLGDSFDWQILELIG